MSNQNNNPPPPSTQNYQVRPHMEGAIGTANTAATVEGGLGNTYITYYNCVFPAPVAGAYHHAGGAAEQHGASTDPSQDPSLSTTVPPVTVTTHDSNQHATPSEAAGRDLWYASEDGDLETVRRIVAAGRVDVNYRGVWGRTPVMEAALNGHRDVVEFLVGEGADPSLVDKNGDNILHLACMAEGDLDTVKLIVSLDVVDINYRNNKGETAADLARDYRHQRVVDLLVSHGGH